MSLHDYLGLKFWFAIIGFTVFAFTIGGMIVD